MLRNLYQRGIYIKGLTKRNSDPNPRGPQEEAMVVKNRALGLLAALGLSGMMVAVGCQSKPPRVPPPTIDPSEAGTAAIDEYDTDGDEGLSHEELAKCPAILSAMELYDQNRDGKVNADEIADRIRSWQAHSIGVTSFYCKVLMDGQPLDGAVVKLVPETFLGDAVKPATGLSGRTGLAVLAIAADDLPDDQKRLRGIHVGLFKVEVTHPSVTIPARYNTATILGQETAGDSPNGQYIVYELTH